MEFNYDYFISYAHTDDLPEGFVSKFVEKLRNDPEHARMFGQAPRVFFDKSSLKGMDDWNAKIQKSLATSRFLVVMLSPGYFQSEFCAKEFEWWLAHEMHRFVLKKGTAPMKIVQVEGLDDYSLNTVPVIPERLQKLYPNWVAQLREYQSDEKFDLRDLQSDKIDEALRGLKISVEDRYDCQERARNSKTSAFYRSHNPNFVGRRKELYALRDRLANGGSKTAISAIHGLGGMGKTELALTYGHAFSWDYELGRMYRVCENSSSFQDALHLSTIAAMYDCELPQGDFETQFTFIMNRLGAERKKIIERNRQEKCPDLNRGAHFLMIFDNVRDMSLFRKSELDILPDFIDVIITTREDVSRSPHLHPVIVEQLSKAESVELLGYLRPFGDDANERAAAEKIAHLLDGFTLAVELTGAYLKVNPEVTYAEHFENLRTRLRETISEMAQDSSVDLTRHQTECVAAVLEPTFQKLSPDALTLLRLSTFFAPEAIPLEWFEELSALTPQEYRAARRQLEGYALLTPAEADSKLYTLHRLVALEVEVSGTFREEFIPKIRAKCKELLERDISYWCASGNSWQLKAIDGFYRILLENWTVETDESSTDFNLAWTFFPLGDRYIALGKMDDANEAYQTGHSISLARTEAMPNSVQAQRDLGVSYGNLGDLDKATGNTVSAREYYLKMHKILECLATAMPENVQAQRDLSASYKRLGDLDKATGNTDSAREYYLKMHKILECLATAMPDSVQAQRDLSMSYNNLGDLDNATGNTDSAREYYLKSLEIRERLATAMPDNVQAQRDLSISYDKLGDLDNATGNTDSARKYYLKLLEISERLVTAMPDSVQAQRDLSVSYERLGDLDNATGNTDSAREYYLKDLEISERLATAMPDNVQAQRDLSVSYGKLGDLDNATGNTDSAREYYLKSLEISKRLVTAMPDNVQAQRNLGVSYNNLGDLDNAAGNTVSAREYYLKSLEISERLATAMPDNVQAQRDLSISYDRLGDLDKDTGNTVSAREYYLKSLEINERLATAMPDNVQAQRDLSISYERLGDLDKATGNTDSAREYYLKMREIFERLATAMPDSVQAQRDLSMSYNNLGDLDKATGNTVSAREYYLKSLEIRERLATAMPDNVQAQRDLSVSYGKLGDLDNATGNTDSAREYYLKSLEISKRLVTAYPQIPEFQFDLVVSCTRMAGLSGASGDIPAAISWYERCVTILKNIVANFPQIEKSHEWLKIIQAKRDWLKN